MSMMTNRRRAVKAACEVSAQAGPDDRGVAGTRVVVADARGREVGSEWFEDRDDAASFAAWCRGRIADGWEPVRSPAGLDWDMEPASPPRPATATRLGRGFDDDDDDPLAPLAAELFEAAEAERYVSAHAGRWGD
jgi:hypothetical protein